MFRPNCFKVVFLFGIITLFSASKTHAQWSISATYENKPAASDLSLPSSGFGIQLERDMSLPLPLVFLRTRAHYSYFNDSDRPSFGGNHFEQVSSYDFGIGMLAGANIALLSPYVGIGVGLEDYSRNLSEGSEEMSYAPNENEFYYQAMIGLGLNVLPAIQPFAELRYSGFSERSDITDSQQRLMIGLAFRF